MTDIQVTSAQVEQIANAFARTDHMNGREFRRTMVLETLNNWRYSLYSAEQQAIQAEAAERENAAKALELAEAGDLEAGKRAWQALKVLRPNLDGTEVFEGLPHAKKLEYVTLAAGVVAEPITEQPTHGVNIGDQAIITNKTRWISHDGEQDVPDTLHGKIVTVTKLGSVADPREVEVQESGQAGGWRMLPDGLAKVFHGRGDWEIDAKAVVTGPTIHCYDDSDSGHKLGQVVTLMCCEPDFDGDLMVEEGYGYIRASSLTRVIA